MLCFDGIFRCVQVIYRIEIDLSEIRKIDVSNIVDK